MRILIACPTLGVSSEVWILRQIDGLVGLGHDVSVLCWQSKVYTPQDFTDRPVLVVPKGMKMYTGLRRWIQRLQNIFDRNFVRGKLEEEALIEQWLGDDRPDVILCHFGYISMRVLPIARRLGIPVVAHFHGLDLSSMLKGCWYRWSIKKQAKRFAQNIVVGSHQASLLQTFGVEESRLNLIPCGVPTQQFNPQPRISREIVRFIQVSRLVAWKGVEQAIRAFDIVHKQRPSTRFTIVGDGEQIDELKKLVSELGLDKAVTFTGPLSPQRVVEQFQEADVFLQHSLTYHTGWCEGFGVSIAEAAAMSLPLVVTRSGGIPDQVIDGKTGFLVTERDVQTMAKVMLKLVDSADLREQLGNAGRHRMIEHFDTVGQIAKLESALVRAAAAN